jgi:hypothetical protein
LRFRRLNRTDQAVARGDVLGELKETKVFKLGVTSKTRIDAKMRGVKRLIRIGRSCDCTPGSCLKLVTGRNRAWGK